MVKTAPPSVRRRRGRPPLVADRRHEIVEAAFTTIAEKGLEGLRLREVASAAGVDHSTIHHYFATKQDLLAAVVDFATRPFWGTTPQEGEPREKIRRHLAAQARMIAERPDLLVVLREFDLRARRDAEVAQIIETREAGWRAALRSVFASGAERGDWMSHIAIDDVVELIIAAVKGASLRPRSASAVLAQLERVLIPPQKKKKNRK
jgi:AcrR family transcriptional regulator